MVGVDQEVKLEMPANISTQHRTGTRASPALAAAARPGMLANLADAANLITLTGLALAFSACWSVLSGRPSQGMALAAMALVMDYADGWMARRAVRRDPAIGHFGAHLDCFADYINKGVFPALFLLTATDLQFAFLPVAVIYLMAVAIRYSYEFVPNRAHIGLSPDYTIVFLCLTQLAAPQLGPAFIPALMAGLLIFAALAIAPFPSPRLTGWAAFGFCLFLVFLAAFLLTGGR